MPRQAFAHSLPSASEFLEFAKKSKVNLDVSATSLIENADSILRFRPGYVLFNIRCGLLIVERPELEVDIVRDVAKEG
jgi:hypothetical protein